MPPGGVHAFDTKGTRRLIVVDPLGSVGTARAVIDEADLAAGRTAVIAPDRFMEEVFAESVVAGNAMSRRPRTSSVRRCHGGRAAPWMPGSARSTR